MCSSEAELYDGNAASFMTSICQEQELMIHSSTPPHTANATKMFEIPGALRKPSWATQGPVLMTLCLPEALMPPYRGGLPVLWDEAGVRIAVRRDHALHSYYWLLCFLSLPFHLFSLYQTDPFVGGWVFSPKFKRGRIWKRWSYVKLLEVASMQNLG